MNRFKKGQIVYFNVNEPGYFSPETDRYRQFIISDIRQHSLKSDKFYKLKEIIGYKTNLLTKSSYILYKICRESIWYITFKNPTLYCNLLKYIEFLNTDIHLSKIFAKDIFQPGLRNYPIYEDWVQKEKLLLSPAKKSECTITEEITGCELVEEFLENEDR